MSVPNETGPCELLAWDSRWFGLNIGRVRESRLTPEKLSLALSWCRVQRVQCLYLLAEADDFETARLVCEAGFLPVDIRVTLKQVLGGRLAARRCSTATVRLFRPDDLPALKTIAGRIHTDSRFFFDRHFLRAQSEAMYEAWVDRCAENADGWIFVAECDGRPAGYAACGHKWGKGRIDLFGVAEWAQGNGLGNALLAAALAAFQERGASGVSVVTQFRNMKSLHLYQKHGFRATSLQQWYHKWFEREPVVPESPQTAAP